jgi:ABC-type transporter Mla MlaB component
MERSTFALDCSTLPEADIGQIDRLARLQLSLRRRQCELRLANAGEGLLDLVALVGLAAVLGVEPGGKAEEWKEPGGVEEEGELRDPTA